MFDRIPLALMRNLCISSNFRVLLVKQDVLVFFKHCHNYFTKLAPYIDRLRSVFLEIACGTPLSRSLPVSVQRKPVFLNRFHFEYRRLSTKIMRTAHGSLIKGRLHRRIW